MHFSHRSSVYSAFSLIFSLSRASFGILPGGYRIPLHPTASVLYCGTGTITLCLARRAGRVIGAEIVPPAVADARENAARNGIENVEFFCGDAAAVALRLEAQGLKPDVVTVDPPRKGLAAEVIASIAGMGPERVVYVSCDPATLGRDVKIFTGFGYRADRACAVDLFPGTRHVETIVLLQRENS